MVQLIDLRTGPTPDDLRSVDYLAELGIPVLFAFTKSDKLTATKRKEAFAQAVKTLQIEPDQAIAFSSLKGDGREELLETLGALLFSPTGGRAGGRRRRGRRERGRLIPRSPTKRRIPAKRLTACAAELRGYAHLSPGDGGCHAGTGTLGRGNAGGAGDGGMRGPPARRCRRG